MTDVKDAIERVWLDTQKYLDRRDTVKTTVDIIDILTDHARLSAEVERACVWTVTEHEFADIFDDEPVTSRYSTANLACNDMDLHDFTWQIFCPGCGGKVVREEGTNQ